MDIVAWADLTVPAESDELVGTVHYGEMAQVAADVVAGEPRNLIESVAGSIADDLLSGWPLGAVEVTVHKPAAPIPLIFDDVAVTIRRER